MPSVLPTPSFPQAPSLPSPQTSSSQATSQAPVEFLPYTKRAILRSPSVSRSELLLFRLIERLSKGGPGCVLNFAKLAEMLQRCERQTWTLWGRLVKSGWIAYRILRTRGRQSIEFWPLVRVQERVSPVFVGRETALCSAPSKTENCTLDGGTPYRPLGTAKLEEQQTATVDPVVVSLLTQEVGEPTAKVLAADREARDQGGLTAQAVRHVLGIFRAQKAAGKIANPGAWLRCALRQHESYLAPAPPPTHPSERPPVVAVRRVVVAPPKPLPPPTDPTLKRLLAGIRHRSEVKAQ